MDEVRVLMSDVRRDLGVWSCASILRLGAYF